MNAMQKYARQHPEAVVMDITPEIAKEMLSTSPGNRVLRSAYVLHLSRAMSRGEWRVTSQGIGFNKYGQLRDAHHRLNACIHSGVSIRSVVVMGMDANAYEVTDIGLKRSYRDLLNMDSRETDIYKLGCEIALVTPTPTVDQMRPIIESGLGDVGSALVNYCGTTRKVFSCAAMKLAACISVMNGADKDYVFQQYRALCLLDFDSMTQASKSLVRQVNNGTASVFGRSGIRQTLARGLKVFDQSRKDLGKITISDADVTAAASLVRAVLMNSLSDRCDIEEGIQ